MRHFNWGQRNFSGALTSMNILVQNILLELFIQVAPSRLARPERYIKMAITGVLVSFSERLLHLVGGAAWRCNEWSYFG